MMNAQYNPHQPHEAIIVERIDEGANLFSLRLKFSDQKLQDAYEFEPGQFNMLYLYGVGEIAISIVSDPEDSHIIDHTIRIVGRVTRGMANLKTGDRIGLRGPYGRGWPILQARQKDVIIVTGGLGCAPVVSAINYIEQRREDYGRLNIVQGVKHSSDLIWKSRYDRWRQLPQTRVFLTADVGDALWPWHVGLVTTLFDDLEYDPDNVTVMMCGPEGMMRAACTQLLDKSIPSAQIFLSMERNMQCALGHCGHCQFGSQFICKNGPVFSYDEIADLFSVKGF